ncbi:MAG: hypothetical protein LRY73_16890 [Bacillus sp. (in: Bacteria)]|nr:hypothetical protein [Bacillus sp. (in: firmicutes)]
MSCSKCGVVEDIETIVLRSVREFHMLFPDEKITTKGIYEWCGWVISVNVIRRILKKHFKHIVISNASFFEI